MFFNDYDTGVPLNLSIGDIPSVLSGMWFLVHISCLSARGHRLTNVSADHFHIECNIDTQAFSFISLVAFSALPF